MKILTDIECMSGTGWYPVDDLFATCPEYGVLELIRLEVLEVKEEVK